MSFDDHDAKQVPLCPICESEHINEQDAKYRYKFSCAMCKGLFDHPLWVDEEASDGSEEDTVQSEENVTRHPALQQGHPLVKYILHLGIDIEAIDDKHAQAEFDRIIDLVNSEAYVNSSRVIRPSVLHPNAGSEVTFDDTSR